MTNPYQPPSSETSPDKTDFDILPIINFWEKNRIMYNIVVGITGILGTIFSNVISTWHPIIIILGAMFYGLAANFCYCIGPYINIIGVTKLKFTNQPWKFLFYIGLLFSIVVTLIGCLVAAILPLPL